MPITPLIHVTAAYSNAVLMAILPHVSDCAKQLDLPIAQPITANQVAQFRTMPYKEFTGGGLWLTNGYWFSFEMGYVGSFSSPDNYFRSEDVHWPPNLQRFYGKDNMTTNEAIQLARESFRKLGYKPEDFHVDGPPSSVNGPCDMPDSNHIPFCQVHWDSPESIIQAMLRHTYNISFEIDMQRKQVVGMNLSSRDFFRPQPKIDIEPELESDYRKRMKAQTSTGTNSPAPETQKPVRPSAPFIHVTADYSNAMLRATLPLISDFTRKLNLPVARPVTASQVVASHPSDIKDVFANVLILTNHYWFMVAQGYVGGFSSPDNWFEEKGTRTDWPRYRSKDCLTTNEAIELARRAFRKLGYQPKDHLDGTPTEFENAVEDRNGMGEMQYAYCRISWDGPDKEHEEGYQFDIDMQRKQVVGMVLISTNFWRPSPKIDVVPELESVYQKQTNGKMFVRTNAPPHWPANKPSDTE